MAKRGNSKKAIVPTLPRKVEPDLEQQMRVLANFLIDRILLDIKNGKCYK